MSFNCPQWLNNWFFSFIGVSEHQIITWPSVISPRSAQDEPVSLNLQHSFPSLYQTLHFPVPFSSHSHKILPLLFSPQVLIWSEKIKKGKSLQRWATLAKGHTLSSHYPSLIPSYLCKTKTVVRETVILLRCQPQYSDCSAMSTEENMTSLFTPQFSFCQSLKGALIWVV